MRWLTLIALLVGACGDDGNGNYVAEDTGSQELVAEDVAPEPDVAADTSEPDGPVEPPDLVPQDLTPEEWDELYGEQCKLAERVALIEVFMADWGQIAQARFKDKVASAEVFKEVAVDGGCRLLDRAAPECTPSCNQQTEQCNLSEDCEPLPALQDIGPLTISGLNYEAVLTPNANNDYSKFDFPQEPLFGEGALISATASGGPFGVLQMQGRGVAEIVMTEPPASISKGASLELAWEASEGPGEIFVQVSLENHATTPLTIQCTVDDTGGISVPQNFVDQLLEAWVAGTVVATVQRRTVDAEGFKNGCFEFQVFSDWDRDLEVK